MPYMGQRVFNWPIYIVIIVRICVLYFIIIIIIIIIISEAWTIDHYLGLGHEPVVIISLHISIFHAIEISDPTYKVVSLSLFYVNSNKTQAIKIM